MSLVRLAMRGKAKSFGRNSISEYSGFATHSQGGANGPAGPGVTPRISPQWSMDRTLNLAIVALVVAGAFAVTLAFLVW